MMNDDRKPALLDYDEVRAYLGRVSRGKVKDLATRGEITKVQVGRRAMFSRASVEAFVQRMIDAA
jgi:excisionase family DNA binding protein